MSGGRTGPVRYWARSLLGGVARRVVPFRDSVLLLSMRRSGSTLLMQAVASQPGFDYSDQPLDFWRYHPHAGRVGPIPPRGRILSPDPAQRDAILAYLSEILGGRARAYGQWRLLGGYHFTVRRTVAKLVNGLPFADWLVPGLPEARPIYLVRHPVPTALSVMRRGWPDQAEALLAPEGPVAPLIDEASRAACRAVAREGTDLQRYVLEWGLENLVAWRQHSEGHLPAVSYEELVGEPEATCTALVELLGLPDPERMLRILDRPSRTTVGESRQAVAKSRGGDQLVARWMDAVGAREAREALAPVRDMLGIDLYTSDDPRPTAGRLLDGGAGPAGVAR